MCLDGKGFHPSTACTLGSKQWSCTDRLVNSRGILCHVGNLLCKLYTELSEILSGGCQVVTDDGDVLLDVENH